MISPCPRCGANRTDPVRHGVLYNLVRLLGYRLHRCSQCRLPRFIPVSGKKSGDSEKLTKESATSAPLAEKGILSKLAEEEAEAGENHVTAAPSSVARFGRCPNCGSIKYHRTHRTSMERLLRRPKMARCEHCRLRFPYPRHDVPSPELLKSWQEAVAARHFAQERRVPEIAGEKSEPKGTRQVTAADSSKRGLRRCPVCGSTDYRRSQRTTLERLLLRPRMARCRRCRKRFPYPKS